MKTVLHKTRMDRVRNTYDGVVFLPVEDDCNDVPDGDLMADFNKKRNVGNHRRFFAFINTSFDMQDEFDSKEVWRKYITMKAGFFDEVITGEGKVLYWPQSISWDSLDEIAFKDMFSKVTGAFTRYYGKGLTEDQFNMILEF